MNTPTISPSSAVTPEEKGIFARIGERITKMFAKKEDDTRRAVKDGYPKSGTGKRQGARVAAQIRNSFGYPFAASERCIEAIKARREAA